MKTKSLALLLILILPNFANADVIESEAFPLTEAKFKDHKNERYVYGPVSFTFREDEPKFAQAPVLKITDGFGKTVYGPAALPKLNQKPFGPLWTGDLNQDGKPDYVVKAGLNHIYVILSGEDKPTVLTFETLAFESTDIKKLNDGTAAILIARKGTHRLNHELVRLDNNPTQIMDEQMLSKNL
jgi:hypothetical protein